MRKEIIDAVDLLASLTMGETVKISGHDGSMREMYVSRTLHRSDGQFGSYESSRVTVTFGPGRYAREVTAEQLADGRVTLVRIGAS